MLTKQLTTTYPNSCTVWHVWHLGNSFIHLFLAKLLGGDFAISIEVQLFEEVFDHFLCVNNGLVVTKSREEKVYERVISGAIVALYIVGVIGESW